LTVRLTCEKVAASNQPNLILKKEKPKMITNKCLAIRAQKTGKDVKTIKRSEAAKRAAVTRAANRAAANSERPATDAMKANRAVIGAGAPSISS
jgi:hypothetical protein